MAEFLVTCECAELYMQTNQIFQLNRHDYQNIFEFKKREKIFLKNVKTVTEQTKKLLRRL